MGLDYKVLEGQRSQKKTQFKLAINILAGF